MQISKDWAIAALRVVLGFVVTAQAGFLAFDPKAIAGFARTGFPDVVRFCLAWSEIAAGILFLIPATVIWGAWLLLAVFLGAIAIHLAHGAFDVGALLIYSAAVIVVMAHRKSRKPKAGLV
ncbi:DoxX family protein [candidate division KSB1 bacterium]|nr:DoxX family protein [candidate division KSB1 bacterium]